jgi:hypothetical protein
MQRLKNRQDKTSGDSMIVRSALFPWHAPAVCFFAHAAALLFSAVDLRRCCATYRSRSASV